MGIKQYKRDVAHQRIRNENQNGIPEGPEYDAVTVNAMVVDQACRVKTIGIKTPKTLKEFIITFKTENGEILKLNAPEEMYDGFDKNQTGILTLVDGRLYGFELTDNADSTI